MFDLFNKWEAIERFVSDIDDVCLKSIVCMLIDYTAVKSGKSSKELLEEITPIIIKCNEELGEMVIESEV